MDKKTRAVLEALDAGAIIDSSTGGWTVTKGGKLRQPIPERIVRDLFERGWIWATRNPGGWTGRALITGRGSRALTLTN